MLALTSLAEQIAPRRTAVDLWPHCTTTFQLVWPSAFRPTHLSAIFPVLTGNIVEGTDGKTLTVPAEVREIEPLSLYGSRFWNNVPLPLCDSKLHASLSEFCRLLKSHLLGWRSRRLVTDLLDRSALYKCTYLLTYQFRLVPFEFLHGQTRTRKQPACFASLLPSNCILKRIRILCRIFSHGSSWCKL